jgi:cytosine/adenosine deaminase-related metal-dependent hydrolase
MSVAIASNRIVDVTPSVRFDLPADARVVDCSGKFLLPGLWDMHTHVMWEAAEEFLPACIANGITGVRDLHTTMPLEDVRKLRVAIESGKSVGPRFLYSGPLVDGPQPFWPGSISVTNGEQARSEVRRLHAGGVDMIKVYEHLARDSYYAIVDECKRLNLPFGGHVPQSVTALDCSDAGQRTIEHLSDVLTWCSDQPGETNVPATDPNPPRTESVYRALASAIAGRPDTNLWPRQNLAWFDYEGGRIWRQRMIAKGELKRVEFVSEEARANAARCIFRTHFANESSLMTIDIDGEGKIVMARPDYRFNRDRAAPVFERFRTNNTWHCPTLTVHTGSYRDLEEVLNDARRRYFSTEVLRKSKYYEQRPASASTKKRFEQYLKVVKAMNDAGVGLLAGTDTPLGSLPGFALHTELELMVRAGLKPVDALRSATLNPARCFKLEKDLGTVSPGKLADLLLLDANPIEDIRHTTRIRSVVANGRLYDRADIDQLLMDQESKAKSAR